MTQILKQSTAVDVLIGPFVDSTDGYTAEAGVSPSVKLSKNGQALASKNDVTTPVHDADGYYNCELDATDTNTVGTLVLTVAGSATALAVRHEFMVIPANAYDSLVGGTDNLQVDTIQISGDATAADNAELAFDGTGFGFTGCTMPTVTTLTGHTAQTGDSYARLGAPAGASIAADIATVDGNVDAILVDTGTTLDTKINDIQGATFSSATDSLEAIRDRGDAAWTTGAGGSDRLLMVDTTIATLASQTSFTLTAGSTDDNAYNNCTIVIEDASTSTQKAVGLISAYTGATKTVTLKYDPAVFTMAATDKVYVLAENALKSTAANRQLDVTATGAAGIDWANVENQTTAVDLSATDIQLCDTTTAVTNGVTLANGAITDASLAGNMEIVFETDFATNYNATRNAWATNVQDTVGTGNLPADVIAVSGDTTAADNAELAFDGTGFGFTGCTMPTVTTLTGHTAQTGDSFARLGAPAGASVSADIAALPTDADVNAQVLDVLNTDTFAEPGQEAPAATTTLVNKIGYLYKFLRNKIETTSTTISVYDDAGSTVDQKSTISDDSTTYTRGEFGTGP